MSPTYIGLRSQRKMPPVTSALAGFHGSTWVPAARKASSAGKPSPQQPMNNMPPMTSRCGQRQQHLQHIGRQQPVERQADEDRRQRQKRRRRDHTGIVARSGHGHIIPVTRRLPSGSHPSCGEPIGERRIHRLRPLDGGEMAAAGHDRRAWIPQCRRRSRARARAGSLDRRHPPAPASGSGSGRASAANPAAT